MESKLKKLFDFQTFEDKAGLRQVIGSVHARCSDGAVRLRRQNALMLLREKLHEDD